MLSVAGANALVTWTVTSYPGSCSTVTPMLALRPAMVALSVALPGAIACTNPVSVTCATALFDDDQLGSPAAISLPASSSAVAVS